MNISSKYLRVIFKLYLRSLRRSSGTALTSIIILFVFIFSSFFLFNAWLNNQQFEESTFTKWNNYQNRLSGRSVAGYQISQCDNSTINFDHLAEEIKLLESQYETGHFIEGNWFGVNLADLPSIQAQFLADYGKYIGNKNKMQSFIHCKDVPCILGKFYNDDKQAGLLAYYWYLKTGSMISMTNKIPGQESDFAGNYNNKKHLFNDYLFTKDELHKFFILAKSLPEKFLHNPLLKSIHKIPNNANIEKYSTQECATSTAHGHILINQNCLGHNNNLDTFLLNVSSQMARYIDIYEGKLNNISSLSSSKFWLDKSLWIKDEFFDLNSKEYHAQWFSHMPSKQFITREAKLHPSNHLADLIAYYRFKPAAFTNNTPIDLQEYIKNEIYNGQRFDANGLYKQYLTTAVNFWAQKEVDLWSDCLQEHLKPETFENSSRDLASQVDIPLYACVEKKIPNFISDVENKIKNEHYEGCRFFNHDNDYGHLSSHFHKVLDKFLQEKILKRKIEFQNHGPEMLVGQSIKHQFIKSIDPTSIFINCFGTQDHRTCYEEKMLNEVNSLIEKKSQHLSEYYKKIIKEDILFLYPYNDVKTKTNVIAKKFITPFYNKIKLSAEYLWSTCKEESFSLSSSLNLPMKFTGGKHFVNAKLLNCINEKIDEELYEIVDFGAFHERDEKIIEFKLNSKEKEFALSFMQGKLVQILNNILDEEVKLENAKLATHFDEVNQSMMTNIESDKDFFNEIYSFTQVRNKCLEKVHHFYPEKYFYQSESQIDSHYGRKICSTIISQPKIKAGLTNKVNQKWQETQKLVEGYLNNLFKDYVSECNDEYPLEMGRAYMRNSRMRKICIEESFEFALQDSLRRWQDQDEYQYFQHKEQQLEAYLLGFKHEKVAQATQVSKPE